VAGPEGGGSGLKVLKVLKFCLRLICAIMICMLTVIISMQVVNRNFMGHSFTWVEELAGISMIYITFLGSALATINNSNTRIDFFIKKLPGKMTNVFDILVNLICIAFVGILCCYSLKLMGNNLYRLSAAMKLPVAVNYFGMLFGGVLMILFFGIRLYIEVQKYRGKNMTAMEEALNK
jgi:TRAP-type C4-dicarboxylate transport system permease small subunit